MKALLISLVSVFYFGQSIAQAQDTVINSCNDVTSVDINETIRLSIINIEKDSMDFTSRYELAMSYYKLQDMANLERAMEQWDFIIKYDKCFNYALTNRSIIKLFLKDKEGFCEDNRMAQECAYPDMNQVDGNLKHCP